jgi:2-aminoethylphosphonate dioxygenase
MAINYRDYPREFSPLAQLRPRPHPEYGLSPEQVAEYYRRGFVILKGVLAPEDIAALRDETARLVTQADLSGHNLRYTPPADKTPDGPWKVDPCIEVSPLLAQLVQDRRLADKLRSLYGGYPPRLFKDKLIIKPAGSHGNDLHQDYNWWQGFPTSLLTVLLPLDTMTRENGCTELWTGHTRGFLHQTGTLDGKIDPALLLTEEHVYAELEPGDMAIFSCFAPHAAGKNCSSGARRALFLSYNDSRDGSHRDAHYDHYFAYMTAKQTEEERRQYYW